MKVKVFVQVSRMILLAAAVSIAMLALMYVMQHSGLLRVLATVSWNG